MELDISAQTHEPFSSMSEWVTDEEVKTPDMLPKVCGWNLLIRPLKLRKKTKGGLILPDGAHSDIENFTNVGLVVGMGNTAYRDDRFGGEPWCEIGDYVIFHRHAGVRFRWQKVRMLLIPDDKIMMVVKDPSAFDASEDRVTVD